MRLSEDIDFTTLTWVKGELDETLKQARQALEAYVEDPQDSSQMRFCATYLHQVHGTLRMVELYGAAMVTEEMERLAIALMEGEVDNRDDAYSVLMRGIVQLPDYLERLQSGHRDIPIVLLPLLNELRGARGEKGLSESVLFTPDLTRPLPASASGPASAMPELELRELAEQQRTQFQLSLLKWFRGEDVDGNVDRLADVCDRLVASTSQEEARRLFWVAAGVLEALRAKAFEPSPQLKQTIGKVEREIKRLADAGEGSFRADPPRELTRSLLYFVAHAPTDHGRIGELRELFRLDKLLPSETELAHAQGVMSGHNRALMDTVSAAIKDDLMRVKDALDLHLRNPDADIATLQPQVEVLDRVGDTLGMLGLGVARRVVQDQYAAISDMLNGSREASESSLLDVAGALLYVEATLDDQVEHMGGAAAQGTAERPLPKAEGQRVLDAVVKEAQANFAQVKQCFVAFVESSWDHAQLADVPRMLDEVSGAFRILELDEPPKYLTAVGRFTEVELLARHRVPNGQQMDTLADVLASLEYFIEALREHRPRRDAVLETTRDSLEKLGYWPIPELPADLQPTTSAPATQTDAVAVDADAAGLADASGLGESAQPADMAKDSAPEQDTVAEPPEVVVTPPAASSVPAVPVAATPAGFGGFESAVDDIDEEIREVFIEEVQEEIANLDALLPAWVAQPENLDLLKPIRRVFHTLKGSGRLVGALTLGEFSWKIENMLNRILDQSIQPTKAVQTLIGQACDALPEMLAALRGEGGVRADIEEMKVVAEKLGEGHEVWYTPATSGTAEPEVEAVSEASAEMAEEVAEDDVVDVAAGDEETSVGIEAAAGALENFGIDPLLFDILKTEVAGHLEGVDRFLDRCTPQPVVVDEPLLRAVHTMNGAFAMTEVPGITEVVSPLEGYIKRLLAQHAAPSRVGIGLMRKAVSAVREVVIQLEAGGNALPDLKQLAGDLAAERDTLPEPVGPSIPIHPDDEHEFVSGSGIPQPVDYTGLIEDAEAIESGSFVDDRTDATEQTFDYEADDLPQPVSLGTPDLSALPEQEEAAEEVAASGHPEPSVEADDGVADAYSSPLKGRPLEPIEAAISDIEFAIFPTDAAHATGTDDSTETTAPADDDAFAAADAEPVDETDPQPAFASPGPDDEADTFEAELLSFDDELAAGESAVDAAASDEGFELIESDLEITESTEFEPSAEDRVADSPLVVADESGYVGEVTASAADSVDDSPAEQVEQATDSEPGSEEDAALAALISAYESEPEPIVTDVHGLGDEVELTRHEQAALPETTDAHGAEQIDSEDDKAAASEAEALAEQQQEAAFAAAREAEALAEQQRIDEATREAEAAAEQSRAAQAAAEREAEEAARKAAAEADVAAELAALAKAEHAEPGQQTTGDEASGVEMLDDGDDDMSSAEESAVADDGEAEVDLAARAVADAEAERVRIEVEEMEAQVAAAQAAESPDPDEALDMTDLDDELLDIFMEEGGDILDHSDGLLASLREDPSERDAVVALQRDLHTLKGGARMAGLPQIGDLGHAMESLLEAVAEGKRKLDRPGVVVLERAFDRLHAMVTRIGSRRALAMPNALIERIEAMVSGERIVAETALDLAEKRRAEQMPAAPLRPADGTLPKKLTPFREPLPEEDEETLSVARAPQEQIRIRADLLDRLVNAAGEVAIYRARLEQQLGDFRGSLVEMEQTNTRLREQLRRLEIETEAQIIARYQREAEISGDTSFDPLELDRFSTLQQLSRALGESAADLVNLQMTLEDQTRLHETLLLQQSRVSSDLQEGLMRTRMVPFDSLVPRLRRILRQTTGELGKKAQLRVDGAQGEMDRNVLDRMTAPLEHMLRNALAHGMESPKDRRKAGKPEEGTVRIALSREASEVVLRVSDDGRGMDRDAIRSKAIERGLMKEDAQLSDRDLYGFVLETGFSTATSVSKIAGRGVGMDVVNSEIKQLGGSLYIESESGKGTEFVIRLPLTLAVTQAVFVQLGDTSFAMPISSVQGVSRIARDELESQLAGDDPNFQYVGEDYQIYDLGLLLGQSHVRAEESLQVPLLLARSGDLRAAICVDQVIGSREIVVKPTGPQISSIPGVFGATVMGDGRVVVILDVVPLVRHAAAMKQSGDAPIAAPVVEKRHVPVVMVVDDSITMRKVSGRILERHNYEVMTAKDGLDAIEKLQDRIPDVMLLDIEMPRMDGYELATHMRNDPRLRGVPIIMITSRTGEKHRQRAFEIGVDRYLGKPYQEAELMRNVKEILEVGRERRD